MNLNEAIDQLSQEIINILTLNITKIEQNEIKLNRNAENIFERFTSFLDSSPDPIINANGEIIAPEEVSTTI